MIRRLFASLGILFVGGILFYVFLWTLEHFTILFLALGVALLLKVVWEMAADLIKWLT